MQVSTPSACPRDEGDFAVRVNWADNSDPFAIITLDEDGDLAISFGSMADADRLIKAAADARRKLDAALSGRRHAYAADGGHNCERCGVRRGHAIHQAPGAGPADVLAASVAAGTPVIVSDDEAFRPRRPVCECVFSCADDPETACSLSGEFHVHPGEPCLVHPDAPGDR